MACPADATADPMSDTLTCPPVGHLVLGNRMFYFYELGRGGGYLVCDENGYRLDGFGQPATSEEVAGLLAPALRDALDAC